MTRPTSAQPPLPHFLSFGEAARLTGLPKEYLRELAEAGRLAVHQMRFGNEPKARLTRGCLVDAGLLHEQERPSAAEFSELLGLVREQAARIESLEEQRFQLGAQLGAALERLNAIEARVTSAPDPVGIDTGERELLPREHGPRVHAPVTARSMTRRIGALGAAHAGRLTEQIRPLRGRWAIRGIR